MVGAQLLLIIILCCWPSRCFCNINIHKKTKFYECFLKENFKKLLLMKVDAEAKFQGLKLLMIKLSGFPLES